MNRSPQGSLIPLALLCLVAGGLLAYFTQPAWMGLAIGLLALIFLFVGLISGAVVFLFRDGFIGLYGDASLEAQAYSRQFINVISVTIIGTCYQAACLFGLVKSGGDISFVFKNDTIFVFLVVIPSSLIAMWLGAPPWVVFACLKCDQILKCFVAVVKVNKYNWMKT